MILEWIAEATGAGAREWKACEVVGYSTRTLQRWRAQASPALPGGDDLRDGPKRPPANRLSAEEREKVLSVANSPRFRNQSPKQIVPRLADEGEYVASESTFYRVLRAENQLAHRGAAAPRQSRAPQPVVATGPGQLWSWDITYLRSPVAGVFFYAYVAIDVWSRKIVAHAVHAEESTEQAAVLVEGATRREGIAGGPLILHSDNGAPMKGATLKATLERLGVMASFSRPGVSDDNPFSEALFRTLKYRPAYPRGGVFDDLEAAQGWLDDFVRWYNHEHLHSGINFVSPADRHQGCDVAILDKRRAVYQAARAKNPGRWTGPVRNCTAPATVAMHHPRTRSPDDRSGAPSRACSGASRSADAVPGEAHAA